MVAVAVKDYGQGIPPTELENIFLPFHKIEASRTKVGKEGPGLGLTIADVITRYYGGTIRVASEVGVGSTFTILLHRTPVE